MIVISALVTLSSCDSASSSGGDGPSSAIGAVCTVLQTDSMATVGEDLLKQVSGDSWAGGLAVDVVISAVQENCHSLLTRAIDAVSSFFGNDPQQTKVATVASFQSLSSAADGDIAGQLDYLGYSVSGNSIATLVTQLCGDIQGSRDSTPVQDVQALLPNANLTELSALNGVTAEVTRTCNPLDASQADGLVSTIYQSLLDNQPLQTTPLVVTSFTWSWMGQGEIQVSWASSYSGAEYTLWGSDDGQWKQLSIDAFATSTPVSGLYEGHYYQFAVRAFADGVASPWAYMTPCLSCSAGSQA